MDQPVATVSAPVHSREIDVDPSAFLADDAMVEDELLVEEVSIDGMCGVY